MSQVRAAVLTNFDAVARFVGIDPTMLLRSVELDTTLLREPEHMLPVSADAAVLEEAAKQSGCDQYGLLMAESRSLGSIGPLSLLLKHEPRVGDVIEALVRYQRLFGDAIHIESAVIDEATCVRIELLGSTQARQAGELALALFCRCIGAILDRRWRPESIHFIYPAPADLRIHRRMFPCTIAFECDFNTIVCTRDALQERNPAGDAELAAHAEHLLAYIMPPPDMASWRQQVRRSLRLLLPEGRGTIHQVALSIRLTPRSLQRQLAREGSSFGALLNEVRCELAKTYLAASHQVSQVAYMSGYHSASSFTRWFNAQFGMSPMEWRKQMIEVG